MPSKKEITLKTIEVLESCAAVFENNPDAWTQGDYAKTTLDFSCSPHQSIASKWCSVGAIDACAKTLYPDKNSWLLVESCRDTFDKYLTNTGIAFWNDQKGQSAKKVAKGFYTVAEKLRESLQKN